MLPPMHQTSFALSWKLRRVAAGKRLLDIYLATGISVSRYRLIELGKRVPTALERRLIEEALPSLPLFDGTRNNRELAAND
jgi:hypothetical protein